MHINDTRVDINKDEIFLFRNSDSIYKETQIPSNMQLDEISNQNNKLRDNFNTNFLFSN